MSSLPLTEHSRNWKRCEKNTFTYNPNTISLSLSQVLELLLKKYDKLNIESMGTMASMDKYRKTLVSVLHLWLDIYPEDWDISSLENLIVFSSKNLPNSELHLKALNKLDNLTSTRGPSTSQWFPYHPYYDYTSCNEQLLAEQFNDICLNPAFRGPGGHLLNTYRFPNINVKHFAEQLTRMVINLIFFKFHIQF
jgi:ral guanine nucleotide dissociation stimulator-like 1